MVFVGLEAQRPADDRLRPMKLTGTVIPGYRLDKKTGKPVKNIKRLDASKQIAAKKRVRVKRGPKA